MVFQVFVNFFLPTDFGESLDEQVDYNPYDNKFYHRNIEAVMHSLEVSKSRIQVSSFLVPTCRQSTESDVWPMNKISMLRLYSVHILRIIQRSYRDIPHGLYVSWSYCPSWSTRTPSEGWWHDHPRCQSQPQYLTYEMGTLYWTVIRFWSKWVLSTDYK